MSVSSYTKQENSEPWFCGNITAQSGTFNGEVSAGNSTVSLNTSFVDIIPTINSSDVVTSNPSLRFGSEGQPYIPLLGRELRVGVNGAESGFKILTEEDGQSATVTVVGDVIANNVPALRGRTTWSGSSDSLVVAAVGMTPADHVHVTVSNPPTEATEFSHVVAGTNQFTVNLTSGAANTSNDLEFNWMSYTPP